MSRVQYKLASTLATSHFGSTAVIARFAAVLVLLVVTASAQAQWGNWGYHSSTYEEGVQRGYADVVRSQGMARLLNSKAATEYEAARRAYIENQLKATQTYFEMRRYNDSARAAARSTPLSNEEYVRIAREQAPDQLTATQLDPLTGAIGWPVALRAEAYRPFRERLEKLFHDRATGYPVYNEILTAVQDFQNRFREDIMRMPANDFVSGRRFLDSLAFAARGIHG
jgi:hypothetical protein